MNILLASCTTKADFISIIHANKQGVHYSGPMFKHNEVQKFQPNENLASFLPEPI
jgi:hypothetical protein